MEYLSLILLLLWKKWVLATSIFNLSGQTWSSVAADELFECGQNKQLVAKVIMIILHCYSKKIIIVKVIRTSISSDEWQGTHYVISLFDTTGSHDVSMVTMLVEQNLARYCDPDVSTVTIATLLP